MTNKLVNKPRAAQKVLGMGIEPFHINSYNGDMSKSPDVDAYIAKFEGLRRERLETMRDLVISVAPLAEEAISYGLVGYKLGGKPLVYFGAYPNHIGFYATPNGHEAFAEEFSTYKQGKGSVQFPLDQPLPVDLITRVVDYRKKHIGG